MKKVALTLVLLMGLGTSFAQTAKDVFMQTEYQYTWLGIDFSHAKFIGDFANFGDAGEKGPVAIKDEYFDRWNNLILNESTKYNVAGMVRKEDIEYETSTVESINAGTVVEDMEDKPVELSKSDVQKFVNSYEFETKEGIGMFFVCEYMNKIKAEAVYHVVIMRMDTKEILLHSRETGAAGGFGLRNYWAKTYYNVIEQVRKKTYNRWKKANKTK